MSYHHRYWALRSARDICHSSSTPELRSRNLIVPSSVYCQLGKVFDTLTGEKDLEFRKRYGAKNGQRALAYLEKTYRRCNYGNHWIHSVKPSRQTEERILQLIPTVMSAESRFALFEEIVHYNERNPYETSCQQEVNKPTRFSYSYEEWCAIGMSHIKTQIRSTAQQQVQKIGIKKNYGSTANCRHIIRADDPT